MDNWKTETSAVLRRHAGRYPAMTPQDAVKLLYQNEFGGGHLIHDAEQSLTYLRREYAVQAPRDTLPLWEDIGNGLVRVMLPALDLSRYSLEDLNRDFVRSAALHRGSKERFLEKLSLLRELSGEGVFSFDSAALEAYLRAYAREGYPMVSHSESYRLAYAPAYRVVLRPLAETHR